MYDVIPPDETGALACRELGLTLWLEEGELQLADRQTGERLLTEGESEREARQAAEAEVERLRQLLKPQGQDRS